MARKDISTAWTRDNRNAINDNFKELYEAPERIEGIADEAVLRSNEAIDTANQAETTAEEANNKSDFTQTQLDQVTQANTIDPAVDQMKVDTEGVIHPSADARLRSDYNKVTSELAQTTTDEGFGVISGGVVGEQTAPEMSVKVDALTVHTINGNRHLIPITTIPISPSSATLRRRDLIYVDNEGIVQSLEGTPSTTGDPPTVPDNVIPLAIVTIKEGVASITKNQILDKRVFKLSSNSLQSEIQTTKNNNAISNRASEGIISKMLDHAQSYVKNRHLFDYGSNDAFRDGTIFKNEFGSYEMTCSTFCHLIAKGIPFENSKYNGLTENILNPNFNNDYEVTPAFVTFRWAEWAYNNGYLFKPKEDFSNLQAGDMLMVRFRKPEDQLVNRDMAFDLIEHSAMFVEERSTGLMVYEQGSDDGPVFRTYTPELLASTFEIAYVVRLPYTSVDWIPNNLLINGNKRKDINGSSVIGVYNLNKPLKNHKWYTVVVKGKLETPGTYLSFYSNTVNLYSTGNDSQLNNNDLHVYHFCTEDKDLSANIFRVLLVDSDGTIPESARFADIEWIVLSEGFVNSIDEFIDGGQQAEVQFTFANGFTGYYRAYNTIDHTLLNIRVNNANILTNSQLTDIGHISGIDLLNTMNIPCNVIQQLSASPSYANDCAVWVATDSAPYRLRIKNGTTANQQFLDISCVLPRQNALLNS